jgi:predicted lipoprotein with Yx(FWY)xxD motif
MKLNAILLSTLLASAAITACAADGYNYSSDDSYADDKASPMITLAKVDTIVTKVDTSIGEVFATAEGLTLYTFTKDAPAKSNCDGGCAASWPPFTAKKNAKTWGEFSVIERSDGSYQWAYKNQPLYTWVGDKNAGDINGHEMGKVWYAVKTK